MTGRRAVIGLCMLCALAFSAFAAQSAAASTKGTTAFTCKNVGTNLGKFTKAHCKPGDAGTGNFEHVGIAANTTTEITGTNDKTNADTSGPTEARLKAIIGGVETELVATTVHGTGTMTNAIETAEQPNPGEHYAHGTGTITYTGVTVAKPAGKGCKVFTDTLPGKTKGAEGVVDTRPLIATTTGEGDFVKFEGEEKDALGNPIFASFFVECTTKVPALEGTWDVIGSITCKTDGATILCDHNEITTQNKLKAKGNKAGLSGALTISGRANSGEATTPLSTTTVETP